MKSGFDRANLARSLAKLPTRKQAAFGAACCARLLPNYVRFRKEFGRLEETDLQRALEVVWRFVGTGRIGDDIEALSDRCEALIPQPEEFETEAGSFHSSLAQDACLAICALLDFLGTRDVREIVQTASYSRDCIDLIVQEAEALDTTDPDREEKVLSHPLMLRELDTQERDLAELAGSDDLVEFRRSRDRSRETI